MRILRWMSRRGGLAVASVASICGLMLPAYWSSNVLADTYNWIGPLTGTQSWNVNGNWDIAGFPTVPGDVTNLTVDLSGNQVVNLVVPITVGSVNLGDTSGAQTQTVAPGAGGTLTFDNSGSGASLTRGGGGTGVTTVSAPVVLAENLTITNAVANGTLSLSGGISGAGGIIKEGDGRTILAGASNYFGTTIVNDGFLQASGAAIPSGYGRGDLQVNGTGRFEIAGATTNINGLSGDGSVALSGGTSRTLAIGSANASSTFSGQFVPGTGTGVLLITKLRDGTLTLNPTTGYANSGQMMVDGGNGSLVLDFTNMGTPTDLLHQSSELRFGGGTMLFKGQSGAGGSSQTSTKPIVLTRGSNAIVVDENGGLGMNLNLAATITRTATSTIDFSVNGGNSAINTAAPNNADGIIGGFATFGGGSTWAVQTGVNTIGGLSNGSYLTTSTAGNSAANYLATSNVDVNSSPGTISAGISVSTLRFSSAAANALTLQGTNTTNGILVSSSVGSNNSLITGGSLRGALVGGAAARDLNVHQHNTSGILEIGSQIVDNTAITALTKSGAGTLRITNPSNSYTGQTFVGEGTLQLGASEVIPHTTSPVVLFTTLDMNGFNESIFSLASTDNAIVTSSVAGPSTLSIVGSGNSSMIGSIEDGAGTVSLVKSGAGTLALGLDMGPANTFSGTTTIDASSGLVTLNNSDALMNSTVTAATGKLAFGSSVTSKEFTLGGLSGSGNLALVSTAPAAPIALNVGNNGENSSYSGVLSGGGSLNKVGNGILTLEADNTYTGVTTVSSGTLLVNGSHAAGGNYTVAANGALGGIGDISSSVALSGTLTPGNLAAGTLTLGGLTVSGSATGIFEIDALGGTSDMVEVEGLLDLTANPNVTFDVSVLNGTFLDDGIYNLLHYNDIALPSGGAFAYNGPLNLLQTATIGLSSFGGEGFVYLQLQTVPEPGAFILIGIGILSLGAIRRRCR